MSTFGLSGIHSFSFTVYWQTHKLHNFVVLLPGFGSAFPAKWNQTFCCLLHNRQYCSSFQVTLKYQNCTVQAYWSHQVLHCQRSTEEQCIDLISICILDYGVRITVFCEEKMVPASFLKMVKENSFHKTCVVTAYIESSGLFILFWRQWKVVTVASQEEG